MKNNENSGVFYSKFYPRLNIQGVTRTMTVARRFFCFQYYRRYEEFWPDFGNFDLL